MVRAEDLLSKSTYQLNSLYAHELLRAVLKNLVSGNTFEKTYTSDETGELQ